MCCPSLCEWTQLLWYHNLTLHQFTREGIKYHVMQGENMYIYIKKKKCKTRWNHQHKILYSEISGRLLHKRKWSKVQHREPLHLYKKKRRKRGGKKKKKKKLVHSFFLFFFCFFAGNVWDIYNSMHTLHSHTKFEK